MLVLRMRVAEQCCHVRPCISTLVVSDVSYSRVHVLNMDICPGEGSLIK